MKGYRSVLLAGMIAACIGAAVGIWSPRPVRAVSLQAYDLWLRSTAEPPKADAVVVVTIDEESLRKIGQWPWPRLYLASLADALWEAGAAVVAWDVLFAEPDDKSPERILESWRRWTGNEDLDLLGEASSFGPFDDAFARALARGPSVIASFGVGNESGAEVLADPRFEGRFVETGETQREMLPQAQRLILPIAPLYPEAASIGVINTTVDQDNVLRRTPLLVAEGDRRLHPSLSLEVLRRFRGDDGIQVRYSPAGVDRLQMREFQILSDRHGRLPLNYRSSSFPQQAAWEVLERSGDPGLFQGRIVLIGATAAGLEDFVATPLQSEMPGLLVHATAIDNLLAGDVLQEPAWGLLGVLGVGALLSGLIIWGVIKARAIVSLAIAVLCLAGGLWCGWACLEKGRLLLPVPEGVLMILLAYGASTGAKYRAEERARRQIRQMFGAMVSKEVLRYLEEAPERAGLEGQRRYCSIFFSDLAGFTRLSERMPPERLGRLLNAYMTPMTEIIMHHGGCVDKFNGDAIMAVWGAPYPVDSPETKACLAALDQLHRLRDLNDALESEFGQRLAFRIGIHSGEVTAGNMGADQRFEYTVLGDAVNLAARVEGLNKVYGTTVLVTEPTRRALPEGWVTRRVDVVAVAGKDQPVGVYDILSPKEDADARTRALSYEQAWGHYAARRWDQATACLAGLVDEDPPARWLMRQIEAYQRNPPPDGWDGTQVRTLK